MSDAVILDGLALAAALRDRIKDAVAGLRDRHRFTPGLAVVLIGEDPASRIYVGKKVEQCAAVGMNSFAHRLPADMREEDLLTLIDGLNRDERVDGILVQLPLPAHIRAGRVLARVAPEKDVDGFSVVNAGRLFLGTGAMVPCTPLGCLALIKSYRSDVAGLCAVVAGRSNIVGKPMAQLLLAENCTVTMAHSRTADLAGECRRADILVAAIGRPRMIASDWIKPGAIVIDVGINRVPKPDGRSGLAGDVDFAAAKAVAGAITPVPGGVGPMTVACLLQNTLLAACRQRDIVPPTL